MSLDRLGTRASNNAAFRANRPKYSILPVQHQSLFSLVRFLKAVEHYTLFKAERGVSNVAILDNLVVYNLNIVFCV